MTSNFREGDNNPYALNDDNHKFLSPSVLIRFSQTGILSFMFLVS